MKRLTSLVLSMGLLLSGSAAQDTLNLFNGHNLDGWYTFITEHGINNDPAGIFSVRDGALHIEGKEFGYICTNRSFRNFHLIVEFRWGEKKYPPRENAKRDSGILYSFPDTSDNKVWPTSIECQIQEGDCGDFWCVNGTSIRSKYRSVIEYDQQRVLKDPDAERPSGEWNTIEVIHRNGKCTHIVNGTMVCSGKKASVREGKILLQSEGAEIWYRKVALVELK